MKRNVVLADCDPEEVRSLAEALSSEKHTFVTESFIANGKRTGVLSELKRYGIYFWVGIRTFLFRKRYDKIVGWQQFYVLIYCFLCNVFKVKKVNTVVALNYTYKDKHNFLGGLYKWFMRKCMSVAYLDYIHVLSEQYAHIISEEFSFPRERILVERFGVNDCFEEFSKLPPASGFLKDGYALAIGRSNRDYDFLIEAWKGIEYPLVIISDTYGRTADAKDITILNDVVGEESYPWIANCGVMILPIKDGSICSGDTVLLTAMSAARKIIVTKPSTLAEMYITDGQNAVLAEKEAEALRTAVKQIVQSDDYADLGMKARDSYLKHFSRQSMAARLAEGLDKVF